MFEIVQWADSFHSLIWLVLILIFFQFVLAWGLLSLAYYIVSKDKLRHELFSRQLCVFDGIQEVFTDFVVKGHVEADELRRFVSVTSEAPFILSREVVEHLNEIRSKLIVLVVWGQVQDRSNLPVSEREKAEAAERWLKDHIDADTLQKLFAQDMAIFSSSKKRKMANRYAATERRGSRPVGVEQAAFSTP